MSDPLELALFDKIICLINKTLDETDNYVSPDGNIYHREGDTYTVLTTIQIFLGMFLVRGDHCSSVIAAGVAKYGTDLVSLLKQPFQTLVKNKYPKTYQPDNSVLQETARVAACQVKKSKDLCIDIV